MISSELVTCPVAQEVFAGAPMIIAFIFDRNGEKYWISCKTSLGSLQQGYQGHNVDRARKYNRNLQLGISPKEESEYINLIIQKWNHKVKQYHPWFTTNANALRQEQYLFIWDSCFQLTYAISSVWHPAQTLWIISSTYPSAAVSNIYLDSNKVGPGQ